MGLNVKFVQCHLNDDGVRGCERKLIVLTLAKIKCEWDELGLAMKF